MRKEIAACRGNEERRLGGATEADPRNQRVTRTFEALDEDGQLARFVKQTGTAGPDYGISGRQPNKRLLLRGLTLREQDEELWLDLTERTERTSAASIRFLQFAPMSAADFFITLHGENI
jgi:hypothetical protein